MRNGSTTYTIRICHDEFTIEGNGFTYSGIHEPTSEALTNAITLILAKGMSLQGNVKVTSE